MKLIQSVLFATILTVAAFSAVVYSSCNKNKCSKVVCLHLGTCDGGNCVCPTGFEGNRCQTLSRDKFIFTYSGGDSCSGRGYHQYQVRMLAILEDSIQMNLKGIIGDLEDSVTCTIRSTDSFTFIGSNNSTTFTGTGKMRNDSLWLVYHVVHDTTSYDCKYFGQSLRR